MAWYAAVWTWVCAGCALALGIGAGFGIGYASKGGGPDSIDALLGSMTVDEKIGQIILADLNLFMTDRQIDRAKIVEMYKKVPFGSVFNAPGADWDSVQTTVEEWQEIVGTFMSAAEEVGVYFPVYGIDTVHGANYVKDAAIFPQQLALGCSFNRELANQMGVIGGKDTKAAGIAWNFSPILDVATHPGWPRNYETWSESTYLAAEMSKQLLNGYQGDMGSRIHENTNIAACMKHFLGYPGSLNGHDRGPVGVGEATLMNIYLPVYEAGMSVNAATIMSGFHCQNDDPTAGSVKYLKHLLRDYEQYDGMMVTDYNTVAELQSLHHMVPTVTDALKFMFVNTTTDVTMSSWDIEPHFNILKSLYEEGSLTDEVLDTAAARMLRLKNKIGWNLQKNHRPGLSGWTDYYGDPATIGQDSDWEASLNAARESIVLVKNDAGFLPINSGAAATLLVTGPSSHSAPWMSGGWTISWQGAARNDQFGRTATLREYFEGLGSSIEVSYEVGLQQEHPPTNNSDANIAAAVTAATGKDYVVIGVGEPPYTERVGNIRDITLDQIQLDLIRGIQAVNNNTILVVYEGRPRFLPEDVVTAAKAILISYLPGPMGGQAAGEIIVGETNPSALLSFSYPGAPNDGPWLHYHKWSFSSVGEENYRGFKEGTDWCHVECFKPPQWEFGHGLSYGDFDYAITSPAEEAVFDNSPDVSIEVSVSVTNSGAVAGKWPVLLFVSDLFRLAASPEYKMLQAFDKVDLAAGASTTVTFTLDRKAFEFHTVMDPMSAPIIEDGTFVLRAGVGDKEITRRICLGACEDEQL